MATKVAGKLAKSGKKKGKQVIFAPYLKLTIPANQAKPAPPLGPQLGQVSSFYLLINLFYFNFINSFIIIYCIIQSPLTVDYCK